VIRRWTRGQWVLRVVAAGGLLVALFATGIAGAWPAPLLVVLVAALAIGHALAPESPIGGVAMGAVLAWWGLAFRDGPDPASLVAAAGLLSSHVAGVLAAYGPDGMAVDRATVLLWVRRGLAVLLLSPLVLLVARGVEGQPEPDGVWVVGLAAALVAVLAAAVALRPGGAQR
jgi:hypothetical protein